MPDQKWSEVAENTYILSVPGGWLYRYGSYGNGNVALCTMVFVPFR